MSKDPCFPIHVSLPAAISEMDVKLSPLIVFFVCVTLRLQNASAKIPGMTFIAEDDVKTCTTKYATCSLTIDGNPVMERGEKGDVGFPGRDGIPGFPGAKGDQGMPGFEGKPGIQGEKGDAGRDGVPGMMGVKGDAGEKGTMGLQGPPGVKGERGESGSNGLAGIAGRKGEPGENGKVGPAGLMGLPGPVGPPGPPGSHGVCPCRVAPNTIDVIEPPADVFGTIKFPAEVPCKSTERDRKSGTYYLGPTGKPIEVYCNMTSLETCIRISKRTPEYTHNPSKGAFWLNVMGVDVKQLYNSISAEQLIWLRDRSDSVRQTLKYNCLDSVPYAKHNMSSSVKLWAWNDMVIGPYPTNQSPIFYSVPEATDECKEGSTEWKSTIIELQSSNVYRLPIVDLWIGDIRNAEQKMSIESVELCFG